MYAFIDAERETHGVEPICEVLEIAPSGYWAYRAQQHDPTRRSARAQRDEAWRAEIRRVWDDNHGVYGVRKVWHALRRAGHAIARCTVARLMAVEGLQGVVRGRRVQTTRPASTGDETRDLVQRAFVAERPNQLWVADFTYVATWRGMVYVAFVIDVFSRRIVGWRAHTTMQTALVLDALEQALYDRVLEGAPGALVVHSDRGSQYVSMRYTERLAEAGAAPSVGSVGDAYDNALAESVIGLYKTEVIRRRGPWRSFDDVEFATLEWVAWFNTQRLLEPLGYVPPAEYEAMYHETLTAHTGAVGLN
jgi:transposase InsO family protein